MAINLTLTNLANLQNQTSAVTAINNNNAAIVTAFQDAVALDGTTPNSMNADLNMNSNSVINVANPVNAGDAVNLQTLSTIVGGGTVTNIPSGGTTGEALVKTSSSNYAVGWSSYVPAGLSVVQTWTAAQTFTNSDLLLLGSSTGATTLTSANASATNYTLTLPAVTDTLVTLTSTQTLTNKSISGAQINSGTVSGTYMAATNLAGGNVNGGVTGNLPVANLNSGTNASTSTFWRGDGTWVIPVTAATSIAVGTTTITSGTTGNIFYDNAGVLGMLGVTGTGTAVLSASPTLTGTLTAAAATLSGTLTLNGTVAGSTTTGTGSVVLSASPTLTGTITAATITSSGAITSNSSSVTSSPGILLNQSGGAASSFYFYNGLQIQGFEAGTAHTGLQINGYTAVPTTFILENAGSGVVALTNGKLFANIVASGYDGTVYTGLTNSPEIDFVATQAWTNTSHGSRINFYTVPNSSTAQTLAATIDQDQSLTVVGAIKPGNTVTSSSVPTNFSAAKYITMIIGGTTYYIPCETSTW